MADIYSSFGSQVTIVEVMPQLIPGEDHEAVKALHGALAKRGVEVLLESRVTAIVEKRQDTEVCVQGKDMAERADRGGHGPGRGRPQGQPGRPGAGRGGRGGRERVHQGRPTLRDQRARESTPPATAPGAAAGCWRTWPRARPRSRSSGCWATRRRWTTRPCRAASTPIPRSPRWATLDGDRRGRRPHRLVPVLGQRQGQLPGRAGGLRQARRGQGDTRGAGRGDRGPAAPPS